MKNTTTDLTENERAALHAAIASAIARSVSHTEIVEVEVSSLAAALSEVSAACEEYDHTDTNEGEDVWGKTESGDEFRLLIVVV